MNDLQKREERPLQRRWLRAVGYAILLVTVGVVSCQSLFSAPLPTVPVTTPPAAERSPR